MTEITCRCVTGNQDNLHDGQELRAKSGGQGVVGGRGPLQVGESDGTVRRGDQSGRAEEDEAGGRATRVREHREILERETRDAGRVDGEAERSQRTFAGNPGQEDRAGNRGDKHADTHILNRAGETLIAISFR